MRVWRGLGPALLFTVLGAGPAAARELAIGTVSGVDVHAPAPDGKLDRFGSGVGASILVIQPGSDWPTGFEASTMFVLDDDRRLYDLGIGLITGLPMNEHFISPYVTFGLDVSSTTVPQPGQPATGADRSVQLGVHGGFGLHGFLGESIYFRAEVGYLGAGVGALTGKASLGFVFGGF